MSHNDKAHLGRNVARVHLLTEFAHGDILVYNFAWDVTVGCTDLLERSLITSMFLTLAVC